MINISTIRAFARKAHGDQKYGDQTYDYHLASVALGAHILAKKLEMSSEGILSVRAVAWLHDVVEDTDRTLVDILDSGVHMDLVQAINLLTRKDSETHAEYLEAIVSHDGVEGKLAWIVKVADTASNLQHSTAELNKKRVKKYTAQLAYLMENSLWV